MKSAQLNVKYKVKEEDHRYIIDIDIKNSSGMIAFFTQLQLLDNNGKPVRPSFYSDNFYSFMPKE
ncbi:MAG TPA: hypothetical protein DEQ30_14740, partial [Porphyromonadaceae bacterium]|nr:hypothetical protein [Porphyromonadaceae bacterium]